MTKNKEALDKTLGDTMDDLVVNTLSVGDIAKINELKFKNPNAIKVNGIENIITEQEKAKTLVTAEAVIKYSAKLNGDVTADFSAKRLEVGESIQLNGTTVNGISESDLTAEGDTTLPTTKAVVEYVAGNTTPKGGDGKEAFKASNFIAVDGSATKTPSNYPAYLEHTSLYSTLYVRNNEKETEARAAYLESYGTKPTLHCLHAGDTNGRAGWFESKSDKATLGVKNNKEGGIALAIESGSLSLNGNKVSAITDDIPSNPKDTTLPTTKAVSDFVFNNAAPIGSVTMFAGILPDKNGDNPIEVNDSWLVCDGSILELDKYRDLYNVIGTTYGNSAVGYFYIPDCRGLFVRGVDSGSGIDPDSSHRTTQHGAKLNDSRIGSVQSDAFEAHNHGIDICKGEKNSSWGKHMYAGEEKSNGVGTETYMAGCGSETRPKNIAFYYIIKYRNV